MIGNRGVAQHGRAPALGAGGQVFKSPRPDQLRCLVALSLALVPLPKQGSDDEGDLFYSIYTLCSIGPYHSRVYPGCILVKKCVASLYKNSYNDSPIIPPVMHHGRIS